MLGRATLGRRVSLLELALQVGYLLLQVHYGLRSGYALRLTADLIELAHDLLDLGRGDCGRRLSEGRDSGEDSDDY